MSMHTVDYDGLIYCVLFIFIKNLQMRKFRINISLFTKILHIFLLCFNFGIVNGGAGFGAFPSLLFTTQEDIRLFGSNKVSSKPKLQVLMRNLTQGVGLDINYVAQKICWTDQGLETIQCASYNGVEVENKVEVITSDLILPEGLACDWFTNKLYWTDSETNKIEVATMDGEYRKVLIWTDIDQPRTIALVPMRAFMFWTDWGEVPKIERVGMNGDPHTRSVIVSNHIVWPNGLTVDYEAELLYWIDGKLKIIAVVDYDGKNRRTIVSDASNYPFALTQYQHKFYWTDWSTSSLYMVEIDKNFTTHNPKELIHSPEVPMCIQAWEESRQPSPTPGQNPCSLNNGGCSHLCLLAPYSPGYTCACPIGIRLLNNRTCAPGPEEVLLYAVRTEIFILYLDSEDYTHRTVPLSGIKYSIAVDYDPINGYLYWTDDEVKAIRRARLNGTYQEDVIINDVHHPDGLAIDWVAGNLYWTDTGSDRIEVSRLNGSYRRVLIHEGLFEPRAIVVSPEHGWIFWSDWYDKQPKIERASLDGSDRIVLVNSSLGWPNGVTLDLETSKIYWCDAKIDKIEVANMDGSDRMELIFDNLPHTFGLSLMGDYIYWTDWQRRSIDRAHKLTGENRTTINDQAVNVMGIKAVRLNDTRGNNPCRHNNGGCAQLCLNRPKGDYVCACQMTYELRTDGRSCVLPESFLLYSRNHSIGRISIENANSKNDAIIPISGVGHASSLDFDGAGMRMYWADVSSNALYRAYINGSDAQRVIELGVRVGPSGSDTHISVAVDWLAHNVYWTDAAAHKIEVARLDGSSRRALLWQDLVEPRGLALDPAYGYMYWSEWGSGNCIKRAAMDGSLQSVLISNTGHAKGLTVDYDDRQLYWADILNPAIHRVSLDGEQKKIIISSNIYQPISLTMYKDRIYWTDSKTGETYSAEKNTGGNRIVVNSRLVGISDLLVVHSLRQHQSNQCSVENGGCSNLCLALPGAHITSHICACPTHYTLVNDSCIAPTSFMIYSYRNSCVRLLPDSSDYPEAVLPIQGLNRIKAIDFDPVAHYLYWIDGKTHSIKRALDNGSTVGVIVQGGGGDGAPYDLAVDSLGRLLFWTCSVHDLINVTRLDNGSAVGVVVRGPGIRPRLLAIHPTKRWLFWTDNGEHSRLTRTRLDGSQQLDMVLTKQNITAIALDLDNDMVVWVEGNHVFMCNIDGDNKHSVSEMKSTVSQLAVHGGSMYWLERSQNQLRKLDLRNARQEIVRLAHGTSHGMSPLTDLVSVRTPPANHSCAASHRCSHICIGNATTVECACPQGLSLEDDRRTCSKVPECGRDHFTCGRNRYTYAVSNNDCIPVSWRCDGQPDCQDSSDEADCPTCQPDQFRCQNGDCIDQTAVCDGTTQCTDASDEVRCCSKEEFKCPRTDVCISLASLCDGTDNCADGADESETTCTRAAPVDTTSSGGGTYVAAIVAAVIGLVLLTTIILYLKKRCGPNISGRAVLPPDDQASDPLSPKTEGRAAQFLRSNGCKLRNVPPPDVIRISMLGHNHGNSQSSSGCYERCHITGASSSTNGSSLVCYPRETLNPPPSPATTAASSPGPRHRPYRHYRSINQPPPPTPCSTDVCDESDCNYPTSRGRYDAGPFPPPPTPRSHCHSESCPPSPSSRSSTYFSPLPPPPSPVPSTPCRGYDS